jgi:hypothetical protein
MWGLGPVVALKLLGELVRARPGRRVGRAVPGADRPRAGARDAVHQAIEQPHAAESTAGSAGERRDGQRGGTAKSRSGAEPTLRGGGARKGDADAEVARPAMLPDRPCVQRVCVQRPVVCGGSTRAPAGRAHRTGTRGPGRPGRGSRQAKVVVGRSAFGDSRESRPNSPMLSDSIHLSSAGRGHPAGSVSGFPQRQGQAVPRAAGVPSPRSRDPPDGYAAAGEPMGMVGSLATPAWTKLSGRRVRQQDPGAAYSPTTGDAPAIEPYASATVTPRSR